MPKVTDLESCKKQAIILSYAVKLEADEQIPFICKHPFTDTMVHFDGKEMKDLSIEENANEFLAEIENRINKVDSLTKIFCYLRSPYYLTYLRFIHPFLSDKDFAEWLNYCWINEENPNQDVNVPLKTCISWFKKADKKYLMSDEELEYYNALPNVVKVYRGVGKNRNPKGLSYTVNRDKAVWFAKRWGGDGYLIEMDVPKEHILAYFNSRGEDEIVVDTSIKEVKGSMKRVELQGD